MYACIYTVSHTPGEYSNIWLTYPLPPTAPHIHCLLKNLPSSDYIKICLCHCLILFVSLLHLWSFAGTIYITKLFQIGCGYNLSDTRHQGIEFTRLQSSWPQVSYLFFLSFFSLLIVLSELTLVCQYLTVFIISRDSFPEGNQENLRISEFCFFLFLICSSL